MMATAPMAKGLEEPEEEGLAIKWEVAEARS